MSEQTPHSEPAELEEIRGLLKSAWRKARRKYRSAALLWALLASAAGLALASLLEHAFFLPAAAKAGLLASLLAAAAATGYRLWNRSGGQASGFRGFYLDFCEARGLPALRHALDLALRYRDDAPERLRELAVKRNLSTLDAPRVRRELGEYLKASPGQQLRNRFLAGAGGGLLLLLAASLFIGDAAGRALHFWKSYERPNPYSYTVSPGDATLEQGQPFEPRVVFRGERPENLSLAFKTEAENNYRHRPPARRSAGAAGESTPADTVRFDPVILQSDGSYYVEMDGFRSETYRLDLQLRPRFETLRITVHPPSYTGLDSASYVYPFSRIETVTGSRVRLSGVVNKQRAAVRLRSSLRGDTLLTRPPGERRDGRALGHAFTLRETDSLSFSMEDAGGLTNRNPFAFVLAATADRAPWAEISRPEGNPQMETPRPLTVAWEVGDDFGLQAATLDYELQKAFTEKAAEGSIPVDVSGGDASGELEWDIPALGVGARDRLTFRLRAVDNDPFNGPKEGTSRTVTVRFPSVTENMDELSREEEEVQQSLEEISESYEQMRSQFDRFEEQLRQNPETDWEQRQTLQQVEEQREQMQQQVEELNKKFEEIRNSIQQSDALSPETMQAYEELQKLMNEIDDPGLREALEEIQKAMDSLSQEQLREALQNYEFSEQTYRERLKRTLELFKNLQLNSDLDKMARSLDSLAEEERELEESESSDPDSLREELRRQEAVGEDLEELRGQLDSLGANAPEKARDDVSRLRQNESARMDSLQQMLRRNMEQMQQMQQQGGGQQAPPDSAGAQNQGGQNEGGQPPPPGSQQQIQQQQQQLREGFQQSAGAMREARQQLNQQRRQINMAALQYIMFSLLDLSDQQEKLARETGYLSNRSQAFVEKARTESTIRDHFAQLSDSLYQVSTELPGFTNSITRLKADIERQLQTAVDMMAERNKGQASIAQREALGGINKLAGSMADLMEQLRQNSGQGGQMSMQQFMQQMQQMSGDQQQLNEQLQQIINDVQGDRLTQDQMERLNQLARQQNRIREQLREMQRSGALESGDQMLSELERLSEQMEETINDLRGGQTDPSMARRQQNILSRMLQAEQALNERGEKEEREGTTAEDAPQAVPPEVTLEELQKRIRDLLNDPDRTQFKQDYQQLIERYFELLRQIEEDT